MFLLLRRYLPETPADLGGAIEEGLRAFISRADAMVSVTGENVRELDALEIDLSGAQLDTSRKPPKPHLSGNEAAFFARQFDVNAQPISLYDSPVYFQLNAAGAEFHQARQPDDKLLLLLHRAQAGEVRIEAARSDVEHLVARAAAKVAQKQGVTIDSVKLDVAQPQPRTLELKVALSGRKMFFRATLNLSGTVGLDDDLVARISNLRCSGDGAIAALVCAALTPQFTRVEQRPFPLAALPIGEIQMRDVSFDVSGERLALKANFGDGPPTQPLRAT